MDEGMQVPDLAPDVEPGAVEPGGDDVVDEDRGAGDDVGGPVPPGEVILADSSSQFSWMSMVAWFRVLVMVVLLVLG